MNNTSQSNENENQKPPTFTTIQDAVKEKVSKHHEDGSTLNDLVEMLSASIIAERVELLKVAIEKRQVAYKNLNTIRPDNKAYDEDGNVVSESYSSEQLKKLRESREKLDKLDKAIDIAVNNADYSGLKNLK